MIVKFGDAVEPKFREGMSRALARKFDARQLAEIQTFLATPTGAAYGREMVGLWFEPEVMREFLRAVPRHDQDDARHGARTGKRSRRR